MILLGRAYVLSQNGKAEKSLVVPITPPPFTPAPPSDNEVVWERRGVRVCTTPKSDTNGLSSAQSGIYMDIPP